MAAWGHFSRYLPAPLALFSLLLLLLCFGSSLAQISCRKSAGVEGQGWPLEQLIPPKGSTQIEDLWVRSDKYAIATDNYRASLAGASLLEKGGNLIDAAVAVSFAISVARPQSTGIGGGGFLIMHLNGKTIAFDFRERAPLRAERDMYLKGAGRQRRPDPKASLFGGLAAAVPGTVAGLTYIHSRYGALPLAEAMAPAIGLAKRGFKVYPNLAQAIEDAYSEMDAAMRAIFAPKGKKLKTGDMLVQSDLARTLELIASKGAYPFYRGRIGQDLVKAVQANGGVMTLEDLKRYRTLEQPPLWGSYRGYRIATMPPPSSGIFILGMLGMLERFDLRQICKKGDRQTFSQASPQTSAGVSPSCLHLLAEVMRRGYRERALYGGDPRYYPVPVEKLLSRTYIEKNSAAISLARAAPIETLHKDLHQDLHQGLQRQNQPLIDEDSLRRKLSEEAPSSGGAEAPPRQAKEPRQTTHFSIMDSKGNAVASTQSINYRFGARFVVPGWGIILNDTMDDFSAAPGTPNAYGLIGGDANAIAPGKTPLSSMSPTIVFDSKDGKVSKESRDGKESKESRDDKGARLALGAMGGSFIITAILQTLVNDLDLELHPYVSVAHGRLHHQYLPDTLLLEEPAFAYAEERALGSMGHTIRFGKHWARLFLVKREADKETNALLAVSDPRGDGLPVGEPSEK